MSPEAAETKVKQRTKRLFIFMHISVFVAFVICTIICIGYFTHDTDIYGRNSESFIFGFAALCLIWGTYKLNRKINKYTYLFGDEKGRKRFIICFAIITLTCTLEFCCLLFYDPI